MVKFDLPVAPERSEVMRAIRSAGTTPEMAVRRLVHALGYRFRLHRRDLPGKPDLVFVRRQKVILVHGCFWHGHGCRIAGRPPQSNTEYWSPKLARNRARDAANADALRAAGWDVLVIWECETMGERKGELANRISAFLGPARHGP